MCVEGWGGEVVVVGGGGGVGPLSSYKSLSFPLQAHAAEASGGHKP